MYPRVRQLAQTAESLGVAVIILSVAIACGEPGVSTEPLGRSASPATSTTVPAVTPRATAAAIQGQSTATPTATHEAALEILSLADLKRHALDLI